MSEPLDGDEVAALFGEALNLPGERREAFVEMAATRKAVRREVLSLLAAYEQSGSRFEWLDPAKATALLVDEPFAEPGAGRRVGPYRIVRELGRGGMGVVYLAERADGAYEKRVAVKLLPVWLGAESLRQRFLLERQILARLEHPGIARLLDGGFGPDGEPYFVLEYVEGEPLTVWCDERRLGIDGRLRLFLRVCETVQYAHRRLVVHRDLKPSNILVTDEGEVKLLDFGIAKLLTPDGQGDATDLTQASQRPLTPAYAAPEQLRGEPVTTATDVYALGLLLYELLVGRRHDSPDSGQGSSTASSLRPATRPSAALRPKAPEPLPKEGDAYDPVAAASARGTRPDRLGRQLRGDLDTIVLKALREEPEQRYGTPEALAADLRRHLGGEPITARPASVRYRAGKLLQRHRVAVAATAAVILALCVGLASAVWQARQARQQATRAELEAERSERSLQFLTGLLQHGDPHRGTQVETIQALLDAGAERARNELAGDPVLQGTVLLRLAEVSSGRGQLVDAKELADASLELLEPLLEASDGRIADAYRVAGGSRYRLGDSHQAEPLLREAAARYRRLGNAEREAQVLADVAGSLRLSRSLEEALALQKRVLSEVESRRGPDHHETARARLALAVFAEDVGDYHLAEGQLRAAIASLERLGSEGEVDFTAALLTLAGLLDRIGLHEEAGALFERGIDARIRIFGDDSGPVASARFSQGVFLLGQKLPEAAEESFRAVLAASQAMPMILAHAQRYLGIALRDQGRFQEAIEVLASAEHAYRNLGGPVMDVQAHRSASDRGRTSALAGDPEVAVAVLAAAVAGIEALRGESHYDLIQPLIYLGAAQRDTGDLPGAEATTGRAAALAVELMGPGHRMSRLARAQRDEILAASAER